MKIANCMKNRRNLLPMNVIYGDEDPNQFHDAYRKVANKDYDTIAYSRYANLSGNPETTCVIFDSLPNGNTTVLRTRMNRYEILFPSLQIDTLMVFHTRADAFSYVARFTDNY